MRSLKQKFIQYRSYGAYRKNFRIHMSDEFFHTCMMQFITVPPELLGIYRSMVEAL